MSNDLMLLIQMIQSGDLKVSGGGSGGNSNTYFVLDSHGTIFGQMNHFLEGNSADDSSISITFGRENEINVFSVIANNLSNKNADELWNTTIVVLPGLWGDNQMILNENGSRPIVLSHFTYDGDSNSMFCDFDFFGVSSYWYKGDGYIFKGTVKGLACFSYQEQPKSSSSDINYNTCVLDASYGVLSYNYSHHESE